MTTSKNSGAAVSLKGVIGPAFYETHRLIRAGKIDEAVEKGGRASLKSSYALRWFCSFCATPTATRW